MSGDESKLIDFMAYRARLARAKLDLEEPPSKRARKAEARNMQAWDTFRKMAELPPVPLADNHCQHGVDLSRRGCRACEHGSEL